MLPVREERRHSRPIAEDLEKVIDVDRPGAIQIRQTNGVALALPKDEIEERARQETSMMPVGLANNLTPEQLADLLAYLESLQPN